MKYFKSFSFNTNGCFKSLVSTQKKPNKKSYFWTITSAFILHATRDNWVR